MPTPFSAEATRMGGVIVSPEYVSIIAGTVVLCAVLYAFFTFTRVGVAMQAASHNQLEQGDRRRVNAVLRAEA